MCKNLQCFRIQDTIGNGKAGTKVQCISSAAAALKDGKSVFIDRCNLQREQRAEFVKLGESHGDVHAVVLDLPAKLCISRCMKRTGHEGGLQGGRAAVVVNQMLQKKELPKLSEGFSRITLCQNESDVQDAVNKYGALGPLDSLPSGCFGQKNPVQLGIMKFLKKVDTPSTAANAYHGSAGNQLLKENDVTDGPENSSTSLANVGMEVKDSKDLDMVSCDDIVSMDEVPALAFPSISTADFQFNLEKASDIIVEQVEVFVKKNGNARLFLVDLSPKSKILSLVSTKASQKNIDSSKFRTFVGDITRLHSEGGLHCNVIANAANWRLKSGGGGVNAAIYSAAGQALITATEERAGSLMPGKALVVPLPSYSPLFSREGVTHVIHVLGPNMNPQRPNCLKDDYNKGCKVLRDAYSSLFEGYASIIRTQGALTKESSARAAQPALETKDHLEPGPLNQFPVIDQKGKREGAYKTESNKKCKGSEDEFGSNDSDCMDMNEGRSNEKGGESTSKAWGSWAQALYNIAMHPDKHRNVVIEMSDDILVIDDQYPKAQKHLLVLARVSGLDRLADVHREHLPLLEAMHNVGLKCAEKFLAENKSLVFRLGYHSVPSMRQLHLHVISQDFDSKHLKNKKHWNSFNSPFFRDSVDVIEEVSEHGKATLNDEERYLLMELRCHRCRSAHPNIPRLKTHISKCQSPFPAALLQNGRLVLSPS